MKLWEKGILITAACFTSVSFARTPPQNGLSGELSVNSVFYNTRSNLSTSASATRSDNELQQVEGVGVFPLGNIQYTFGAHQLFAGTSRADIAVGTVAIEAGYQYRFDNGGRVALSVLPTVLAGEVWQDPYLTNTSRSTTDEKGTAYRMQLKKIGGSLFSLDLAYGDSKVDDENSGSALSSAEAESLKRDKQVYYSKLDMMVPLARNFLLYPALKYVKTDAKGEAMSNTGLGGELTGLLFLGHHQFAITLGYMNQSFVEGNPQFDDIKRSDDMYRAFLAYEYQKLLGIDNLSLVAFAGYNHTRSSISFYEKKEQVGSVGFNWRF